MFKTFMRLTYHNMFLRLFIIGLPFTYSINVPVGTFTAKCHERHFWLSVKARFLGSAVQFKVEDSTGIHFLSSQRAAECGYTMVLNSHGDLVFRASYLACHVDKRRDTEFRLQVWFVNKQTDGSVYAYPFKLYCSLTQFWSPREIICEENYMEASVQWHIPVDGAKMLDIQSKEPENRAEQLSLGYVMFFRPGHAYQAPWPIKEAKALGYHIVATDTRMLLRSVYSSPFSYTLEEQNIQVEAVNAIIIIQLEGTSIPVEISMACTKAKPVVDGHHLLWSIPLVLSPLVQGWYRNGGMRIGVGGRILSDCDGNENGYKATLKGQTVEIRIPTGREGAQIKSGVVEGQYVQSLSVELFYMHHWEDLIWLHTQHRSFRLLRTPYVPYTPTFINNTVPSNKMFSVSLAVFPADVSLQNITVGGDTMTRTAAREQGILLMRVPFRNGSHAYTLQIPFSHPLISQKIINRYYRRHNLSLTFNFIILHEEKHFSYTTDIASDVKETVVPARLEGRCTDRGIVVVLHYGSEDVQWELYVENHRLDWELVRLGGYRLKGGAERLIVEIPLFSPGMTYEDLSLKHLVAKVEVSALDVATLNVEHSLIQRCTFPVRDLLVCLPEGRMVVVADTTRSIPHVRPNSTTLLDPSCTPVATDSTRAMFNFSLDSCGTTVTVEGDYLLYENQIRFKQKLLPTEHPLIHMDSPYSVATQLTPPEPLHSIPFTIQLPNIHHSPGNRHEGPLGERVTISLSFEVGELQKAWIEDSPQIGGFYPVPVPNRYEDKLCCKEEISALL